MQFSKLLAFQVLPVALVGLPACGSSSAEEKPAPAPVKPSSADWTMLGYDVGSTYNNKAEKKLSVATAPKLEKAWEIDTGGAVTSTPVISGGHAYVVSSNVIALNLADGSEFWRNADFGGSAAPAIADGVIYVHDLNGVVRALNESDGTQIWEYKSDEDPSTIGFSSPMLTKDLSHIGGSSLEELTAAAGAATFKGFVLALKKDGSLAWKKYTVEDPARGATLWSSVSADETMGSVFAATGNNHGPPATDTSDAFLALPLETGDSYLWKRQILENDAWMLTNFGAGPDSDFGANPIVLDAGGKKLVAGGSKGGDFWALDRESGEPVAPTRKLGPNSASKGGVFVSGAWDGTNVLVAVNGATSTGAGSETGGAPAVLFAIDPLTLDISWERQVAGPVLGFISVANGVGLYGKDKTLQAFDVATGEVLFEYPTEATIATAPAVSNGYVVFGSGMNWASGGSTSGTKYYALKVP